MAPGGFVAATEKPQSVPFVLTAPTLQCRWLSRNLNLYQTGPLDNNQQTDQADDSLDCPFYRWVSDGAGLNDPAAHGDDDENDQRED
jgi:hypothetical protein